MWHDTPQAWIDTDRLLDAYLEQDPTSSSIDLTNDLIAETGLSSLEAMRTVDDYTFRKVVDTSAVDWEAVRPLLKRWAQALCFLGMMIGVGRLAAWFLPPPMLVVIRTLMDVLGLVAFLIMLVMTARNRSTGRGGDLSGRRSGEKRVKSL